MSVGAVAMWDAKFSAAAKKSPNAYVAVYHTLSANFTFERKKKLPNGAKTIKIPFICKSMEIGHPTGFEDDESEVESISSEKPTENDGDHEIRKPKLVKLATKIWAARNLGGDNDLFLLDD